MEAIRIGTLVSGGAQSAHYIKQILPQGFESFSLTFWKTAQGVDWKKLSDEVNGVIAGSNAIISSLSIFGNPLEHTNDAEIARESWEACIDSARYFGTDLVTGFAGRLVDKPINESMARFKEVFTPLVKRAQDQGVRIAFENCDMGGTWQTGDWNIAQNPTAWEMMFSEIPADNLGLQWEPCHQMVSLIDPLPQLKKWIAKVFCVHGKDATIHWDVIKEFGIHGPKVFVEHRTPGFGDSNWSDIITELRRGGFKGCIDIEGWHDPVYCGDLEMTGQVHALKYLKQCRGGNFVQNPRE